MNQDHEIARALQEIPDPALPRDLWPLIAARIHPDRAPRASRRAWLALAACTAMTALLLHVPTQFTHEQARPLAALQRTSAELEQRLTVQRQHAGRYSARMAELERTLVQALDLTDLQLGMATDPRRQQELWQRRIALLSTWHDLGAFGAELSANQIRPAPVTSDEMTPQTINQDDVL